MTHESPEAASATEPVETSQHRMGHVSDGKIVLSMVDRLNLQ